MTQGKITASAAMLNVLKTWGVDTIYGIPSGTLSSLMDALAEDKDIRFLQVRHEETGALAAVMQAKFGGSIGVAVGSGGPGATHLINGVYDAAMDNTPFLAILGSRPVNELNMDAFQELNQNPMYNGIAVYNKRVAYAEQLPKVIDEACRAAVSKKGPAVVEIPVNFGFQEIDENSYYGSGSYERSFIAPALNEVEIDKAVEILNNAYKLGKRHALDASILGDAGQAAKAILDKVNPVESTPWWRANVKNNQNWRDYMNKLEGKTEGELQLYQVYNAINKHADQDAIYSIDVGDTTQTSTRHLHMTPKNMWRTSPLFATMGIALPGGIAAKKDNPDRQVWNIMGDGAFNMCYPDVITNVQYDLPVINVVFSNGKYAFIKDKYEDTNKHLFGCDFPNADYAKIAEAQGAIGFTVDRIEDIDAVVAEAVKLNKEGKTVVIDAHITPHRPLPVEVLELDPKQHSEEAIKAFKEKYEAEELVPFRLFLEEEGLQSRAIK